MLNSDYLRKQTFDGQQVERISSKYLLVENAVDEKLPWEVSIQLIRFLILLASINISYVFLTLLCVCNRSATDRREVP